MNFIAHLLLSGNDDEIIIGNFIADSVKGSNYKKYPAGIQRGIFLHREIDSFTDAHEIVRRSKSRLSTVYGHYTGVLIDIFYDHILVKNWSKYSKQSLPDFAKKMYSILSNHKEIMPEDAQYFLQYVLSNDRINTYIKFEVIGSVLQGMATRTKFISHMEDAQSDLENNYNELETDFNMFFPNLIDRIEEVKNSEKNTF